MYAFAKKFEEKQSNPIRSKSLSPGKAASVSQPKSNLSGIAVPMHYNVGKPARLRESGIAAEQIQPQPIQGEGVVQRKLYGDPADAYEMITKQFALQRMGNDKIAEAVKADNPESDGAFTTVGYEHEFALIGDNDEKSNFLASLTHVELAESNETFEFTGLKFKLETDSNDTIELVGAPLIIPTAKDNPVPISEDVVKADNLAKEALKIVCKDNVIFKPQEENAPFVANSGRATFETMKKMFAIHMGLNFDFKDLDIEYYNFNPGAVISESSAELKKEDYMNLDIIPGAKGSDSPPTQINFATNAFVYDVANDVIPRIKIEANKEYQEKQALYWGVIQNSINGKPSPNETIFLKELAKNLSQINAVKYQEEFNEKKRLLFKRMEETTEYKEAEFTYMKEQGFSKAERDEKIAAADQLKKKYIAAESAFNSLRSKSGWVKDANTFWLKDTLYNFGLGILETHEWVNVLSVCKVMLENSTFKDCKQQLILLIGKIEALLSSGEKPTPEDPRLNFGEHDPRFLGARQDTFISLAKSKRPPRFKDETLHLVEMRDTDKLKEKLDAIGAEAAKRKQPIST